MGRAVATALGGIATLLVGWFAVFQPFLEGPREDVLSTPGLTGLNVRQEVPVPAGRTVCTEGLSVPRGTAYARYRAAGTLGAAPKLTLRVDGPGLARKAGGASVAPAGPDTFLTFPVSPPVGEPTIARLCLQSRQPGLRLVGTDESRSAVQAGTTVAGVPQAADISLALLGERKMDNAASLRQAPGRIEATTGIPAPVTWAIAVAAILLATLGALGALVAAVARVGRA